MKKMNKKGFTIVELVIVIAVIAILAAVFVPTFSNVVTKAKESAAIQEVRNAYVETIAVEAATGTYTIGAIENSFYVTATNGVVVSVNGGNCTIYTGEETATHKVVSGKIVSNG
jgi:type IV pilus assembly protein PilA